MNLWKMAAHSPSTLPQLIRTGNALLTKTRLNPQLREMAILRTAELLDCEYERIAHSAFGREIGISEDKIKGIKDWHKSTSFSEIERAMFAFTDEVATKGKVTDKTFANLAKYLNDGMMVELATTIGFYGMLARILLPFEVDPDEQAPTAGSITGTRLSK
jgi:4-carboxymuconolactone decarboxylase